MGDGPSQGHGECATHSGERETQELTRYQGRTAPSGMVKERGRGGVVQNFQTEEVIQQNRSFPSGLGGMSLSHDR